jgi:hypothetical protein
MADIFLSYAHQDATVAAAMVTALERLGWSVYSDRKLEIGGDYRPDLQRALNAARAVVVLWSEAAVASRWVRNEAEDALNRNILFPASLDGTAPPLGFRETQTADLRSWRPDAAHAGFDKLVEALRARLAAGAKDLPAPTPKPQPPPRNRLPATVAGVTLLLAIALGIGNRLAADKKADTDVTRVPQTGQGGQAAANPANPGQLPGRTVRYETEAGFDLGGDEIDVVNVDDGAAECGHRCLTEPRCRAFVFSHTDFLPRNSGRCSLKASLGEKLAVPGRDVIAGWVKR